MTGMVQRVDLLALSNSGDDDASSPTCGGGAWRISSSAIRAATGTGRSGSASLARGRPTVCKDRGAGVSPPSEARHRMGGAYWMPPAFHN